MLKKYSKIFAVLFFVGFVQVVGAKPPYYALDVAVVGDGNVTSAPIGISCPGDCAATYKKNTVVNLTATPDLDREFVGWGGACAGTNPLCVVQMTQNISVTAEFGAVPVDYPAPVSQTGQTQCFDVDGTEISCSGTGQDGEYRAGVPFPTPRFADNQDGTVTDNLTGLTWLRQADCYCDPWLGHVTWIQALDLANQLRDGECGLTDGSQPGDWRVPSVRELLSLIDYRYGTGSPTVVPSISNADGTGPWENGDVFIVVNRTDWPGLAYWSSTSYHWDEYARANEAFVVDARGVVGFKDKTDPTLTFWAVKN